MAMHNAVMFPSPLPCESRAGPSWEEVDFDETRSVTNNFYANFESPDVTRDEKEGGYKEEKGGCSRPFVPAERFV